MSDRTPAVPDLNDPHPPAIRRVSFRMTRAFLLLFLVSSIFASGVLIAQYQKAPPDFGGTYSFPTPTHPEPRTDWVRWLDVVMLMSGLGLGAWLILNRRNRNGVILLSIGAVAYFGFYRKGCICPIGAIQNVTLSLVDSRYMISFGVIAFFFLPLVTALLFGRIFCGGSALSGRSRTSCS
jgi:NosR/NirI family nitrous oxide reductase transcriptional regulator